MLSEYHKKVVLALEQAGLIVTIEVTPPTLLNEPIPPDSVLGATLGCGVVPTHVFLGILGPSPSFPSPGLPPKEQFTIAPPALFLIRWQQRLLSSCYSTSSQLQTLFITLRNSMP